MGLFRGAAGGLLAGFLVADHQVDPRPLRDVSLAYNTPIRTDVNGISQQIIPAFFNEDAQWVENAHLFGLAAAQLRRFFFKILFINVVGGPAVDGFDDVVGRAGNGARFSQWPPAVLASHPDGHVSAHDHSADGVGQHPVAVNLESILVLEMAAASRTHHGKDVPQCPLDTFKERRDIFKTAVDKKDKDLAAMRAEIVEAALREFRSDVGRAHGVDVLNEAVAEFHLIGGDRQNSHPARFYGI